MTHFRRFLCFVTGLASLLLAAAPAKAVQFSFLAPGYTQEIYAGPNVGIPGAWNGNQLMARGNSTSDILEYSATQNTVYQGTNLHGVVATHPITGLAAGINLTRGTNGKLYLPTQVGLQRVDPSNWAAPAVSVSAAGGPGYGVNALPGGKIVYAAGGGSTDIRIYDSTSNLDSLVYTSTGLIDDIETSPTGLIALAGQTNNEIIILNSSGGLLTQFPTAGFPDGLAFATTATPPALYSNDNHGTITKYDFGLGYNNVPTATTVIASGGSYGDIATPGPDCAFYVTQFFNNGYHGSANFGTHWDDNTINNDSSIIRIALKQGCMVDPPVGSPEPGTAVLMLLGAAPVLGRFRRAGGLASQQN